MTRPDVVIIPGDGLDVTLELALPSQIVEQLRRSEMMQQEPLTVMVGDFRLLITGPTFDFEGGRIVARVFGRYDVAK